MASARHTLRTIAAIDSRRILVSSHSVSPENIVLGDPSGLPVEWSQPRNDRDWRCGLGTPARGKRLVGVGPQERRMGFDAHESLAGDPYRRDRMPRAI